MSGIFDEFSGSLTADVLTFNLDATPAPDTLYIRMTRGERRIAEELRKHFGGFRRVVIDVDGEKNEFRADSLIQMLEDYEDAQGMNNYTKLFGTPERSARTLAKACGECSAAFPCCECPLYPIVGNNVYEFEILEWLRGEGEGE